ncbi:MAG: Mov34/MPN/PAD-1 family protein [Micropepsaceae bacterium]
MIIVPNGVSGQRLVFSSAVLEHFDRYRQVRWWQREAGGQLFARIALPEITIEEATGPRRSDRRTRHSYEPNRTAEQKEIAGRHARGLHFVGDWHTHAEAVPTPSVRDTTSMRELVANSRHLLNGFVLVIVGTSAVPNGLFVSVVDTGGVHKLERTGGGPTVSHPKPDAPHHCPRL